MQCIRMYGKRHLLKEIVKREMESGAKKRSLWITKKEQNIQRFWHVFIFNCGKKRKFFTTSSHIESIVEMVLCSVIVVLSYNSRYINGEAHSQFGNSFYLVGRFQIFIVRKRKPRNSTRKNFSIHLFLVGFFLVCLAPKWAEGIIIASSVRRK